MSGTKEMQGPIKLIVSTSQHTRYTLEVKLNVKYEENKVRQEETKKVENNMKNRI